MKTITITVTDDQTGEVEFTLRAPGFHAEALADEGATVSAEKVIAAIQGL